MSTATRVAAISIVAVLGLGSLAACGAEEYECDAMAVTTVSYVEKGGGGSKGGSRSGSKSSSKTSKFKSDSTKKKPKKVSYHYDDDDDCDDDDD